MGKLIKAVVVLVILGAGIALAVKYTSNAKNDSGTPTVSPEKPQQDQPKKKEGMQVQEKYGFAPVGDGG